WAGEDPGGARDSVVAGVAAARAGSAVCVLFCARDDVGPLGAAANSSAAGAGVRGAAVCGWRRGDESVWRRPFSRPGGVREKLPFGVDDLGAAGDHPALRAAAGDGIAGRATLFSDGGAVCLPLPVRAFGAGATHDAGAALSGAASFARAGQGAAKLGGGGGGWGICARLCGV